MIKFNQKIGIRRQNDMNNDFRKNANEHFKEDYFNLMNNVVRDETMESVRKHCDIKLVTNKKLAVIEMKRKLKLG